MNSEEYLALSAQIYSTFPLLGGRYRRQAARTLAEDLSPQAVKILAEAVTRSEDDEVISIALSALTQIRGQSAIDAFCQVWESTRHRDLTTVLKAQKYVASGLKLKVLTALKTLSLDIIKNADAEILDPLLDALKDKDTEIAKAAAICINNLGNEEAINELCKRWASSRSSQLEQIIRQGNYVVINPIEIRVLIALKFNHHQLIIDEGIEVLETLLSAMDDKDLEIAQSAKNILIQLKDREAIDELCGRWASSRSSQLEQIIRMGNHIASEPIEVRVLTALKCDQLQLINNEGVEVLEPLLAAVLDDSDIEIINAARACFLELKNKQTIDALCEEWIRSQNSFLEDIIKQANYEPSDLGDKALFYFLQGQWQKYEDLDFDQSLLLKVYYSEGENIKERIAEKAKAAGRIEWVKVLITTNEGFIIEQMRDEDWESFLEILVTQPEKQEIWKFLFNAPAIWSSKLLNSLENISFKWFNQREKDIVNKLLMFNKGLKDENFTSTSYLFVGQGIYNTISLEYGWFSEETFEYGWVSGETFSLASAPNGRILASGCRNGDIYLERLPDGYLLKTPKKYDQDQWLYESIGHSSYVVSLAITPDNRILASGNYSSPPDYPDYIEDSIHLWSLPEGNHLKTLTGHGLDSVESLVISSDGAILASGGNDTIRLWSLPDGEHLKTLKGTCPLATSLNGAILASGSKDNTIQLWSLPDGNHLKNLEGHNGRIRSLAISPDGAIIASGDDSDIRLWSLPNGNHLQTLEGHTVRINSLAISPDGTILASGNNKDIRLWSLPDCKHLKTLEGHTGDVWSMAICCDGCVLVSGEDESIRLWRFANIPIAKYTAQDISDIEKKVNNPETNEGDRKALNFTLALIRLRQQFDIDIEEASSDIELSPFDIDIE